MKKINLNKDWKFTYSTGNSYYDKQGKSYKNIVSLPHDFSICQPRIPNAPSNEAGGFFQGGIGTYEKDIFLDNNNKNYLLLIEGSYGNTEVMVNGNLLSLHPYGYTEFFVDCSPFIKYGEKNKFKITVNNSAMPNSRWYTGSGLYRNVWLLEGDEVYIHPWHYSITTDNITKQTATVNINALVSNQTSSISEYDVEFQIFDSNGNIVEEISKHYVFDSIKEINLCQSLIIQKPNLWSTKTPHLYKAKTIIKKDNRIIEEISSSFGIRTISFDSTHGFRLNGETVKLKGGCVHHDNGPIGACAYENAEFRKVRLLKELGYNAIRTSHNPMSRAFLDACDYYGMLVMEEFFDCWRLKKNHFDYHIYFEDWWKRDIESVVLRDRNHPSIIMWSIGNEIGERNGTSFSTEISNQLIEYTKSLDSTRAITNGVCAIFLDAGEFGGILANIFNGSAGDISQFSPEVHELLKECDRVTEEWGDITKTFCENLDVVGYNYLDDRYEQDYVLFPNRVICGTESYPKMMSKVWKKVECNNHVIGDFSWTAMDYFGESGIGRSFYNETGSLFGDYPWHISNCGDIDICGITKPQGEYRKIMWNMNKEPYIAVLKPCHSEKEEIISAWGWSDVINDWNFPGYENKKVRIDIYSNADEVELFINEVSIGKQKVNDDFKVIFEANYTPGCIKAVNYRNNKIAEISEIITASVAESLSLNIENNNINNELLYVNCTVVDKNNRLVTCEDFNITIEVSGGELIGIGTGNPISEENYFGNSRKSYYGRLLAIIKRTSSEKINIKATADNLKSAVI